MPEAIPIVKSPRDHKVEALENEIVRLRQAMEVLSNKLLCQQAADCECSSCKLLREFAAEITKKLNP